MDNIVGKVLVTTDWHIGIKQNSKSRLAIIQKVADQIVEFIKKNDIKTMIFCGDLFHERVAVNVNSLNVALNCIQNISELCKTYLIVGNHDIHMKSEVDINSLNIFKDTPNVKIVSKLEYASINGNSSLLVPWLSDVESIDKETVDMMFGHFDVSLKFLMKSYVEEHSKNYVNHKLLEQLNSDDEFFKDTTKATDSLVGDFVDVVKKNGTIFSGHIHGRKQFMSKGRRFIFVGDPYQQNLGEIEYDCGFYVIDNDNSYSFIRTVDVPKHINLKISDILNDINNFDFSIVKGNIIHKIYDVDITLTDDAKISHMINDWQPYEELLPDYEVNLDFSTTQINRNDIIKTIQKSKLDYIRNYIDNIDKKVLEEQKLDSEKLFNVLNAYYTKASGEK